MRTNPAGSVKSVEQIYAAAPRGFCAGVRRAITVLERVLEKHGAPVYVRHAIVHNRRVVAEFEKKGAVFVEDIETVPDGSVVVFSAHGTPPAVYQRAKDKQLTVYDAVCPLVTKVHLEAKRYAREGYFIVYIGHHRHPEGVGVMGEVAPESIKLVADLSEAKALRLSRIGKLVALTQTTLSFSDTTTIVAFLRRTYPQIILPPTFDICYATQNRQDAVRQLAKQAELIMVVGSQHSSNCNRLKEVARNNGVAAYLVNDESEINPVWLKGVRSVGVAAGASTPETEVRRVVDYLAAGRPIIKEIVYKTEAVQFPLPAGLS
ncbi:4-hydroxy-3-methylbut-2-enyl diphosphate reductase [Patescibacteria group bacterium]|nr:4-hydroxy-3-methylbut-2-enyl diphosphate reductase [Patescibacteria group bacterium]MCL5091367.1 4-hydroxy-3-methylbut-2-enyl diphosphate reductase [Patescibacteria group bacterium]